MNCYIFLSLNSPILTLMMIFCLRKCFGQKCSEEPWGNEPLGGPISCSEGEPAGRDQCLWTVDSSMWIPYWSAVATLHSTPLEEWEIFPRIPLQARQTLGRGIVFLYQDTCLKSLQAAEKKNQLVNRWCYPGNLDYQISSFIDNPIFWNQADVCRASNFMLCILPSSQHLPEGWNKERTCKYLISSFFQ